MAPQIYNFFLVALQIILFLLMAPQFFILFFVAPQNFEKKFVAPHLSSNPPSPVINGSPLKRSGFHILFVRPPKILEGTLWRKFHFQRGLIIYHMGYFYSSYHVIDILVQGAWVFITRNQLILTFFPKIPKYVPVWLISEPWNHQPKFSIYSVFF